MFNLRPISDADMPLLEVLYASARELELSQIKWSDSEKKEFLRQQFDTQHKYYMQHYASARFEVIEYDGAAIGRLYQQWREDEVRLMDIALLPKWRNKGIGTSIARDILSKAATNDLPVLLHVEHYNPAVHWYRRLGFVVSADNGVYLQMRCTPLKQNFLEIVK